MTLIAFDGQLSVPRTFSFDELRALPAQVIERSMLLGGRAIAGVRIGAIINELGVKPWARFAVVRSVDGYAANIALDHVHDCVLVYAVGNAPLPADLGGPFRFLTRGTDRCSNVKQVAAIGFSEAAVEVEHHCPHAIARRAGNLIVLPGRPVVSARLVIDGEVTAHSAGEGGGSRTPSSCALTSAPTTNARLDR